jgi:hypothetical protein
MPYRSYDPIAVSLMRICKIATEKTPNPLALPSRLPGSSLPRRSASTSASTRCNRVFRKGLEDPTRGPHAPIVEISCYSIPSGSESAANAEVQPFLVFACRFGVRIGTDSPDVLPMTLADHVHEIGELFGEVGDE